MTSHCPGTVQMREESESGIRKWEEMWFKTTAEDDIERGAVMCDGRLFHRRAAATGNALSPTVDRRVRRTSKDVDEAERIVVVCQMITLNKSEISAIPDAWKQFCCSTCVFVTQPHLWILITTFSSNQPKFLSILLKLVKFEFSTKCCPTFGN